MSKKNVVSIEDRIPRLKHERRKKRNRRLITYLSVFFFLLSIIVYFQSPLSQIDKISVKGNQNVTDDEIIKRSGLTSETNIWMMKKSEVMDRLKDDSFIKEVEMKRKLPRSVEIHINEYKLVGYIKKENLYLPVVENGQVLSDRHQEHMDANAPLLVNFTEDQYIESMAQELDELPTSIFELVSEVHWNPSDDHKNKILLYMKDGYVVSTAIREFAKKMVVYPSIISQLDTDQKGIVHIGVGAYFEAFDHDKLENEEPEG